MKTDDHMSRDFETLSLAKTRVSEIASYKNRDCETIVSRVSFSSNNYGETQIFITAKKRDCETREI